MFLEVVFVLPAIAKTKNKLSLISNCSEVLFKNNIGQLDILSEILSYLDFFYLAMEYMGDTEPTGNSDLSCMQA